jgi:hypothetical protein
MNNHSRTRLVVSTLWAAAVAVGFAAIIAVPAPAHAEGADFYYQSPSRNIVCAFGYYANQGPGVAHVDCYIGEYTYPAPIDGKTQRPCADDPNGFSLAQGMGQPLFHCDPGGVARTAVLHAVGLQTLDYGQMSSIGAITCDSETAGMTCTDTSTGHFFRVSGESYQLG